MQANVDINLAAHPHLQGEMSEIGFRFVLDDF